MDIMTCTELSISPAFSFHDEICDLPGTTELSSDASAEFSDPQYLTAQIKLVRIKYHITKTISELRYGNGTEIETLIQPCIQSLMGWAGEFSLDLKCKEDGAFTEETLSKPAFRTIASILLRYNQVRMRKLFQAKESQRLARN